MTLPPLNHSPAISRLSLFLTKSKQRQIASVGLPLILMEVKTMYVVDATTYRNAQSDESSFTMILFSRPSLARNGSGVVAVRRPNTDVL